MPDEKDIARLLAILKDENQPQAVRQEALQQLLAHDQEVQAQLFKDFHPALPQSEEDRQEVNEAYSRLKRNINPVRIVQFRKWASIAAALILCISAAWYFNNRPTTPVAITTVEPIPLPSNHYDSILNTGSSTSYHRLPDGSTVHLEPGSSMFYRGGFHKDKKEIFLTGSALFTVQKETGRPFSVYVNGIEVLDLGTVFSIATQKSLVKVKLIQGKVLIRKALPQLTMDDITLTPGEEFRLDTVTLQYSVNTANPKNLPRNYTINKQITFKNTSLQEVFNKLEKACGVSIVFNKKDIADKAFTGTFDAGSNARNMIAMICMINDLNYELKSDTIFIHP